MLEVAKRVVDSAMLPLNIAENYIVRKEITKMDR